MSINTPEKYNKIGHGYNQTRSADPYLLKRIIALLDLPIGNSILDIGCGTGNYTIELHRHGYKMIGVDPSTKMISKAKEANPVITWKEGTAEQTGLNDLIVDGAIATFTIHHWMDISSGLKELNRVIRDDGPLVILTATPFQMQGYWLRHYFPKMMDASNRQMPSLERLISLTTKSGFVVDDIELYDVTKDLKDFFLYSGKHDPERYLDLNFRKGISSFSSLANASEIESGIIHLSRDIASGAINGIIKSYEHSEGDYLFIKAKKRKTC